jgi:dynein heavy chain
LSAVKNSFNALKTRLTHKASKSGHVNKPFFDVDVKLRVPSIMMDPTLEEVQAAINRCALHVLRCSKKLYMWGVDRNDPNASTETFHGLITTDKEIVKAVLLMTGSVEGTKTQVETYLSTWKKYDPLWLDDRQKAYEVFMQSKPDLDTFSLEIQKYMDTALEIDDLPSVKNIGCMALGTLPLKNALKSEVTQWKIVYARNLHHQVLRPSFKYNERALHLSSPVSRGTQAAAELEAMLEYMRDTMKKLDRVSLSEATIDLEDVRFLMNVMKQIRERESIIEFQLRPIEEMYLMLKKNDVRVPKQQMEDVSDLRQSWAKVCPCWPLPFVACAAERAFE